jgi:hypothetical protein
MSPNGQGAIGNVNIQAYPGANAAVDVVEAVSYYPSGGATVLTFPGYGQTIAGQEYLYLSRDGNFVFGGSPRGVDMFVGVRTASAPPNAGASAFGGLYYQAGIDELVSTQAGIVSGSLQSYYGSFEPCPA